MLRLFVFFLFLNSCLNENALIDSVSDNEVLLIINDEGVTSKKFKKVLDRQKKIFRVQDTGHLKLEELIWIKNRALDEVVKNTLLIQQIKNNNINIQKNILSRVLKEVREGYPEGAFAKTLKLEDISMDNWEDAIKTNLLINKLIQKEVNSKVSVGDKELRAYFNENIKNT